MTTDRARHRSTMGKNQNRYFQSCSTVICIPGEMPLPMRVFVRWQGLQVLEGIMQQPMSVGLGDTAGFGSQEVWK